MPWPCPNCGRSFRNTSQDHDCTKPQTANEYIAAKETSLRPRLERLRRIIREAIPDTQERISWSAPTCRDGRNRIPFAAVSHHIGLCPGDEEELPESLIAEIARWCFARYAGRPSSHSRK